MSETEEIRIKTDLNNVESSNVNNCEICNRVFTTPDKLKKHLRIHESDSLHVCDVCDRAFATAYYLKKHFRSHTGEKPYSCKECGSSYSQSGGLKNHIASVHSQDRNFICHQCDKSFPIKERLKLHLRTHTGEKPYTCNECNKSFSRGSLLSQHMKTHTKQRPYTCAICGTDYVSKSNLASHIKRHMGERDYVCHKCGKSFVRRDGLQKHLVWFHANYKAFECTICNKRYKGHLLQHMRIHVQEKPHACCYCGKKFVQRSQLTVHERTHTGIKPYRCAVCHMAFAHSTALKMHVRRHTGEKPFKCPVCPLKAFSQLPHLKKHMLTIHKTNKPYICSACNSDFRTKNQLQDHYDQCENGPIDNKEPEITGMPLEKIRLLLAVLLQKISTPEKLKNLGYGKRLIDLVLRDSIAQSGRDPCRDQSLSEMERLRKNVEILLEWTVPKQYMENFKKENRTMEELLEEFAL